MRRAPSAVPRTGPSRTGSAESAQVRGEEPERLAPVADRVLLRRAHLRGAALLALRDEDRVVAEAVGAAPLAEQPAAHHALEDLLPAVRQDQRRGGDELRAA